MPFSGADLNGTPGGTDSLSKPTYPADVRVAKGGSYVAFLVVNGPLTVRNRASIENIVRTLGTRGEYSMALLIRDDGGVIDVAATDLNFEDGITVTQVSPGVITIHIPTDGITDDMVAEDYATTDEMSTAINAALAPYATSSNVTTALGDYLTETETLAAIEDSTTSLIGPYEYVNVPAGVTNSNFLGPTIGGLGFRSILPMPASGEIIGYVLTCSTWPGAEYIDFGVRTASGGSVTFLHKLTLGNNVGYGLITPVAFNAGDYVRPCLTTPAGFTPTTLDAGVFLLVRFNT